jgi:hypothetical protein
MSTTKVDFWHSRWAVAAGAAAVLLLAYGAISWAIDSGSLWLYLLSIGLIILVCRLIAQAIKSPKAFK